MRTILLFLSLIFSISVSAQKDFLKESKQERDVRMQWWRDATFGMFIHWGAYAVPAGVYQGKEVKGIGEWIMHSAQIPIPEYEEFVRQFNPVNFNAKQWVAIAKNAGMKYIVITSKHHDGFCIWDSKVTDYDIMDASPYKRDILKELADACKEAGVKLCFYHSIMDWHQPDAESKKDYTHQHTPHPDFATYREMYLKPQLKELIQKYDPAVLWFDGEWIPEWTEDQGRDLYNYLRNLKPDLVINNRVGKGRAGMQGMNKYKDAAGDFGTPEQEILEGTSDSDWESCMTMNDTWGFKKSDTKWKSSETLIHNLIDIAAKGGNYLLNVGPTAEGVIPAASVERLSEMGDWLKVNGEAIYSTHSTKKYKENDASFTISKDGSLVYAIITQPVSGELMLKTVEVKQGSKIYMLGLKNPLEYTVDESGNLRIKWPSQLPCKYAWTIRIEGKIRS
ncbi:MAG: alpha-L-fucosidase [Chitinophagaceae bacterium]|jgi:alpha-L-fucosidase